MLARAAPDRTASDLVQDTLLAATKRLAEFRGGDDDASTGAKLRKWLLTIMRNLGANDSRNRRTRKRHPPGGRLERLGAAGPDAADDDPTPGTRAAAAEDARRVGDALDRLKLPPADRHLLARLVFDRADPAAVARELGLDRAEVVRRRNDLLRRLRDELT